MIQMNFASIFVVVVVVFNEIRYSPHCLTVWNITATLLVLLLLMLLLLMMVIIVWCKLIHARRMMIQIARMHWMSNKLSAIIMRCMGAVAKHFHICHNYRPAGFGYWCSNNNKHFGLYDKQTNKSKKKKHMGSISSINMHCLQNDHCRAVTKLRNCAVYQEGKKRKEKERKK